MGARPDGRGDGIPICQARRGYLCRHSRGGESGWEAGKPGVETQEVSIWTQAVVLNVEPDYRQGAARDGRSEVKDRLQQDFKMKDMGSANFLLGEEIRRRL